MEQQIGSKLGKEYVKAVYCHPASFTSMQNVLVAQSCPTLSDPMDCSLPGSSVHGSFQARVMEWGHSFSVVNKAKVGVFLEFSCFFYDQWMLAI